MLSPIPTPSESKKSPKVFLKAPTNITIPPLTKIIKYYTIFNIFYEIKQAIVNIILGGRNERKIYKNK